MSCDFMSERIYAHRKLLLSTLLSIMVVAILIIVVPPSAQAVIVNLTPSASNVPLGNNITFTTTIDVEPGERIPVEGAVLRIYSDSGCTSEVYSCTMTLISVNPPGSETSGDRWAYDHEDNYWYNFYPGYGYGLPSQIVTLTYQCTVNSNSLGTGTFYARTNFSPVGPSPSPTPQPSPSPTSTPWPSTDFLSDIESFLVWTP